MTRRDAREDDEYANDVEDDDGGTDADDGYDREAPDESDRDADEDDPTFPCPHCNKPVHEDAEWCPSCGQYLSQEDAPLRHSWLIWAGAILALAGMLWWLW